MRDGWTVGFVVVRSWLFWRRERNAWSLESCCGYFGCGICGCGGCVWVVMVLGGEFLWTGS